MESLLMLRGVREVSTLAKPWDPVTVSQRSFDEARATSPQHAELPPARRITERLRLSWGEVLDMAHAPEGTHSHRLGRKEQETPASTWLTMEYMVFALKLVAHRLNKPTLTQGEYRAERDEMLSADRARWLHGRQLLLPNERQIAFAVGSWSAALSLAGLSATKRMPPTPKQKILTRMEAIERFHDHYKEKPTVTALRAFVRGNGLPMSGEDDRAFADTFAEWEERRCEQGLPPARVVDRRIGRRRGCPDYSRNVGAARPGEEPYKRKGRDPAVCVTWIARYIAELGTRERSTKCGYEAWARRHPGAPRAPTFARHGGWEKLRRKAQGSVGEAPTTRVGDGVVFRSEEV
jgi:hypothetical protein